MSDNFYMHVSYNTPSGKEMGASMCIDRATTCGFEVLNSWVALSMGEHFILSAGLVISYEAPHTIFLLTFNYRLLRLTFVCTISFPLIFLKSYLFERHCIFMGGVWK